MLRNHHTSNHTSYDPPILKIWKERQGVLGESTMQASEDLLREHYIDLKDRPFYAGLVKYMHSGPVVAMVWEGLNVVKTGRMMVGETNPADSKPGTVRGDFCIQSGRNIIHGSDSVESAEKEIGLWFHPNELVDYKSHAQQWIYE
ncbi:nucleoside diphosphate kinase A isoform X6 [Monodelphis domestica]|uniref:Nucleoside diphosphate kinase n=1 Tax=Monodelphis domestica TaxID=13616 RepID=A0A5F8GM45_MONDO|nr:nucleoside diphosphate kinase A isoform X6 [Monodelphis domestica]